MSETTIGLSKKTRDGLKTLKRGGESYDHLVRRILRVLAKHKLLL